MISRMLLLAIAGAGALGCFAQANSPEADGYIARGVKMYGDANYNGCIDQMLQARQLSPDATLGEEALYYVAMSTLGLGDDEALGMLQSFLARFPESPRRQQALVAVGDYWFTRGEYAQAVRSYELADPACLDDASAETYRYRLAYSLLMMAEYNKAETLFAGLTGTREYGNAARFYQAYISYCRQNYPAALQQFKSVSTATAPGNTADYYISQIYFAQGDWQQALSAAKRVIAANPVPQLTVEARRIAGESLYRLGDPSGAVPYLWQYVAESEDPMPSAYYILGIEEYGNGNYDAAIKLFQQAVGANDAMAQNAYLYLGQCYRQTGNTDNALMAFENAYRMNYDPKVQETAFYNYAVARSEGGKAPFSSSVAVFEDFLKQYPRSRYAPSIEEYLVQGYMTAEDYESALAAINKISQPSDKMLAAKQRVLFMLGARDFSQGNAARALESFTQARAIAQGDPEIAAQCQLWIGDCRFREGQWDEAADAYLAYLSEAPSGANRQLAYYDLGYARYNQHDYESALTDFTRALDTKGPLTPLALADARNRMGDCLYSQQEFGQAAEQYKLAYDLNPSTGDYPLYQMAVMEGYQRQYQQELDQLQLMMDRFPTSGLYPAALLAQAETYTNLGNTSKAIATYNQLVRDYPSSSYGRNGQLQLAITYLNKGDRAAAIDAYRKVVYKYPTSEEARVASDDLKRIYAQDGKLSEYLSFINSVPNAPAPDPSDVEATAFEVAEEWYLENNGADKMRQYLDEFPSGANRPMALYYLAEDAEEAGRIDEALQYATDVVMLYPDSEAAESALFVKGECELTQGKGEIALATFRQLEQKASTQASLRDARLQVMRIARSLGRNAEVVTAASDLLASSAAGADDITEIRYSRAYALNKLGRYDEAYAEWEALAKEPIDLYGAKSAYMLAQSQYDRGLTAKAKDGITRFLASDTPHDYWRARGVILLSDILRKQGNAFEADQYLRAVLNNYTDPTTQAEIVLMVNERLNK